MTYFEFLNDIIDNFRVSKMIDIIKVEQNVDTNEVAVVAYEATRSLIIVADYKELPDVDMPSVQGFSQLDFAKQIINLESNATKSSVKFKETDEGISKETIFKLDTATIKTKNVAETLLPTTPTNLSAFSSDIEITLDSEEVEKLLKFLSVSIFNADIYITKSAKGKLSFKLTNDVDTLDYDTGVEIEDDLLTEGFKIDLERFLSILKIASGGATISLSEKQNLTKIVKDTDTAVYNYFLVRKAS